MEPTVHTIDEDFVTAPADTCPLDLLRDLMDSFADASRTLAEDLGGSSPVATSFGRSVSSAIHANSVLLEQLSDVASRFDPSRLGRPGARVQARPAGPATTGTATATAAGSAQTVVLSAPAGAEAVGAFALENLRAEPTQASVLATTFVDHLGDPVPVDLRLDPAKLILEPGEEVVVRVVATVPDSLAPAEQLHGAIHVPGLTTSMIAVVLRAE